MALLAPAGEGGRGCAVQWGLVGLAAPVLVGTDHEGGPSDVVGAAAGSVEGHVGDTAACDMVEAQTGAWLEVGSRVLGLREVMEQHTPDQMAHLGPAVATSTHLVTHCALGIANV